MRRGPRRHRHAIVEQALDLGRLDAGPQAREQVDRVGLAQRHDRAREHDRVGDHDRVLAARQVGEQQPQRGDGALDLARQRPGLEPDAIAHAERPRGEQHDAGEHVAERLLRGQTDDHGGEGRRGQQGLGFEARDRQREEQDRDPRNEADEEAHRPGGGRVHAAEEQRADGTAERPSDRPAQDQEQDDRGDPDVERVALDVVAVGVQDHDPREERGEDEQLAAGTLGLLGRLLTELGGQPGLLPRVALGAEHFRSAVSDGGHLAHGV